jgi:carotenoid cleavage dioxygenase-like enzyme
MNAVQARVPVCLYGWARRAAPGAEPLYQCDLDTGHVSRHDFGASHIPSETVFVPRTEGAAENDGWLLAYVSNLRASTSAVVILNAQDIGGEPQLKDTSS